MRVATPVPGLLLRIPGVQGVEKCGERNLGVDDDLPAAGEVDDHVGAHELVAEVGAHLGVEVAVPDHAAQFHDAFQLHLTPAAADLGSAQGGDELVGAVAEPGGGPCHRLDLAGEGGIGPGPVDLHRLEVPAELADGLLQWPEGAVDVLGRDRGGQCLLAPNPQLGSG